MNFCHEEAIFGGINTYATVGFYNGVNKQKSSMKCNPKDGLHALPEKTYIYLNRFCSSNVGWGEITYRDVLVEWEILWPKHCQ